MNQKMMKTFGLFIGGFIIFIIILFLISSCSGRAKTYNDYENKLVDGAKAYYKKHEDKLPNEDGNSKKLSLKNLVNEGFVEEAIKFFDDKNISCDGSVIIKNNNGYYRYIPTLSCKKDKDKYSTTPIYKEIIKNVVEEAEGLYAVKDEYIYKGAKVNNYVLFNGEEYRIIRINNDNSLRLIKLDGVSQQVWDKIWNPDYKYASGLNEYIHDTLNSSIKDTIEKYYEDNVAWTEDEKSYIETSKLCIGKRSEKDVTKDGSTECSVVIDSQLGMISVYEYLQASLDTNCGFTTDNNCRNYNWLSNLKPNLTMWTVTASSEDTKSAYSLSYGIQSKTCSSFASLNAVFNISGDIPYISGDGTIENPYIIGKNINKK